jgi:hypothetical protein
MKYARTILFSLAMVSLHGLIIPVNARQMQTLISNPGSESQTAGSSTSLPLKMSYQGLLTTTGGNPVSDGAYSITIAFFDSITSGSSQWAETHTGVIVSRGTFSITLGETNPLNIRFNKPLFVEATVNTGPAGLSYPVTFAPRSQMLSSPYALAPWSIHGPTISYTNGNVGVGTDTVGSLFVVQGGSTWGVAEIIGNGTNAEGSISFRSSNIPKGGVGNWILGVNNNGGVYNQGIFSLYAANGLGAGSQVLSIPTSGNVGIGVTAPSHKLDVNGIINATDYYKNGVPLNTGNQWISNDTSITYTGGKVGVGTTSPAEAFDVAGGNIRVDNSHELKVQGPGSWYGSLSMGWGSNDLWLSNLSQGKIYLATNTTGGSADVRMQITNDGKVGIATNSPTNTLSVGGPADFSGNVGIGTTQFLERLTIGGSVQVGDNSQPYQHLALSGGNSDGYLYGDFGKYQDVISLGYNFCTNGSGGFFIPNTGGATSRISMGYGSIGFYVGGVNSEPNTLGIFVNGSGNVGVGTTSPSQKLTVIGNICYTGSSANCSDIRYKKDITPLSSALDKITSLRGVNYYWRTDEYPDHDFPKDQQIGLIAQEVEKVYPQVVLTDEKGYKSIDYGHLAPALIEAVKELNAKIGEIQNLRTEVNELKAMVRELAAVGKGTDDRLTPGSR